MEISDIKGSFRLLNGVEMPYFGLGVFGSEAGEETIQAILWALEAGYRHIDTATLYGNESSVGEAVKSSRLKREDIFITTKVWNSDQGYRNTLEAFRTSLEKLRMDYIDLYLIHWPVRDKYMDTWEALEKLYADKLVRAIGVSNFLPHHIDKIIRQKGEIPLVNQVEFHPYLVQPELLNYCKQHQIQVEAWSPILKGRVNDFPLLQQIAAKYSKTPVQVTLRWDLQKGVITIPKSTRRERINSNADIFDFELTAEEVNQIDALNRKERIGAHPDTFNF
jgi:diketogulonate reductase-like aldo/keto reductase